MPLFNKMDYCKLSIQSVVNQSFKDYELIIVNDGSTDNSVEIVNEFLDNPQIKLFSITNHGVSYARNYGVKRANGLYVSFLDADDLYHSEYLKIMHAAIKTYPEKKWFGTGYIKSNNPSLNDLNKVSNDEFKIIDYYEASIKSGKYRSIIHISSTVIELNLFKEIGGFTENATHWEDYDLFFRLADNNKLIFFDSPLTYYRIGFLDSLSQSNNHRVEPTKLFSLENFKSRNRYKRKLYSLLIKDYLDIYLDFDGNIIKIDKVKCLRYAFMTFFIGPKSLLYILKTFKLLFF